MDQLTFENGIHIEWCKGDDGGGSTQYIDFIHAIGSEKKYNKCLEWCAGLSAITFGLFDEKIINEAVLMDIYEPALLTAMVNAKNNNLSDKIKYFVCDEIKKLPSTEKFDLVVSNPPHSSHGYWLVDGVNEDITGTHRRLVVDEDWKIHKEFFDNITKYLNEGADIFLSESDIHSDLISMAEQNNLKYVGFHSAPLLSVDSRTQAVVMHFKYETEVH